MRIVPVDLKEKSYDILIGERLEDQDIEAMLRPIVEAIFFQIFQNFIINRIIKIMGYLGWFFCRLPGLNGPAIPKPPIVFNKFI